MSVNTLKRCSIPLSANLKHASQIICPWFFCFLWISPLPSFTAVLTQMTCCVAISCFFGFFLRQCTAFLTISCIIFRWTTYFLLFYITIKTWSTLIHQVAFKLNISNAIIAKVFIERRTLLIEKISFFWSIAHKRQSVNKSVKFTCNYYRSIEWILFFFILARIGIFLKKKSVTLSVSFSPFFGSCLLSLGLWNFWRAECK